MNLSFLNRPIDPLPANRKTLEPTTANMYSTSHNNNVNNTGNSAPTTWSSGNAQELLGEGTPNDVRMFPRPLRSSKRIPIVQSERTLYEMQLDESEAMAEYRDYVMTQRIASSSHGTSSKKTLSHDSIKSLVFGQQQQQQREVLLQSYNNARRNFSGVVPSMPYNGSFAHQRTCDMQRSDTADEDEQEEGIFELEM